MDDKHLVTEVREIADKLNDLSNEFFRRWLVPMNDIAEDSDYCFLLSETLSAASSRVYQSANIMETGQISYE
jgi:hypothetical protein